MRFKHFAQLLFASFVSLMVCTGAESRAVHYQLIDGSYLLDDCPVCARPSIQWPMRGSFEMRVVETGPFSTRYAIEKINFRAGGVDNPYQFQGAGTLDVSSAFALLQTVELEGTITSAFETNRASFTNESRQFTRALPMIAVKMLQTNGTLAHTFTLQIYAAPFHEIWFSTASPFHGADLPEGENEFGAGDLLSSAGRAVKRNSEFQEGFPGPTFLNMGLDAVDLLPGAEIAFSTDTVGVLNDGDYAYARTGDIYRYPDFLAAVAPVPPDDPGLDGLQIKTNRAYYSLERDIEAFELGEFLRHGDLLFADSETLESGAFRRNEELLAQFNPPTRKTDYGLDAFYVWPSGEIWFSVHDGFSDSALGTISDGDILSDRGYIVFRNLELVSAFKPMEDAANFGLDAFTVITDVDGVQEADKLAIHFATSNNGTIRLTWNGLGKVYQVERASNVEGPYLPISPILSALGWEESSGEVDAHFYRVRQW